MVDITIVFIGVISWFINPLITGGPHPVSHGGFQLDGLEKVLIEMDDDCWYPCELETSM